MDKLELVRAALQELGDVSAQDLAAHVERQHGVKIDPKFIPVFKASLRDKLRREAGREAARKVLEQVKAEAEEGAAAGSGAVERTVDTFPGEKADS